MKKFLFTLLFALPAFAAEDYPVFDGQYYNNLYYPNIDILEWGEPMHLQFQIYDKSMPIDISGTVVENGNQKSFIITYDINNRGERLCRRVPAPSTFKVGQQLHFYKNTREKERNIIYVSAQPMNGFSNYSPPNSGGCIEKKAEAKQPKKEQRTRIPASTPGPDTVFEDNRNHASVPIHRERQSQPKAPKEAPPEDDVKYQPVDKNFSWF